jgi:ubiquinol-cytochrome c reductase cytochrome b subunit
MEKEMSTAQEQPPGAGFLETRTGWNKFKQLMFLEPLPGGSRWAAAFGSLLLFIFALQIVTGILLTTNYSPSAETAYPSVKFIQEEVPSGNFIRSLHHWGSGVMVVLLLLHLLQVFVWGAYKPPREFTWMTGVLLLFCTLGLAFTGYLLPWDQKAYWATKVGIGIASTTPLVGDDLRIFLQGGPELGNLTLTRFFTVHTMVLPAAMVLLIVVHLYFFRLHGVTPPWWESAAQLQAEAEPFWPKQVLKDAVLWLVLLVGLGVWCFNHAAPLEAQADPSQAYEARPEWYFMFLFWLLRYFHGPLEIVGTFVLPALFALVLMFWPFIDRNPHRSPRRRPFAMAAVSLGTLGLIGMTIVAIATDVRMTEPSIAKAPAPPPEPAGLLQRADLANVYNTNCAACHGIDGTGAQIRKGLPTIPDFTSLAWQMSQTDLEIIHQIEAGKEPLMPGYRDKLSQRQVLAMAIYVRAFALTAPTTTAPANPKLDQAAPPPVAAVMNSDQLYRAYCMACHNADGRGESVRKAMPEIPIFTDSKWQAAHPDAELKKSILEGKGKFMLAMKDKLSPADADRMVVYLRAFREGKQVVPEEPPPLVTPPSQPMVVTTPKTQPGVGPPPTTASPELAERIRVGSGLYRQTCLSCHGNDGRGTPMRATMPTIPDFTNNSWHKQVSTPQLVVSILDGKGTFMPASRGRITTDQAQDLAAYVRAFGPAQMSTTEVPATDFEKRFRELESQWNELERQLNQLPKAAPKR